MNIIFRIFLLAVMLSFPVAVAQAQPPKMTGNITRDIAAANAKFKTATVAPAPANDSISKLMAQLSSVQQEVVDGVVADINAADADAAMLTNPSDPTSFKDPISHACYPAAVKFLQALPVATPTTGKFIVVQLFQKKRDFVAQIQAGIPVYLKLGCAPLLGDEIAILNKLLGLVGVQRRRITRDDAYLRDLRPGRAFDLGRHGPTRLTNRGKMAACGRH